MKISEWKFAKRQPLGKPVKFVLTVRNVDSRDIPQLTVTVRGLKQFVAQAGAATKTRPVWALDEVNYGSVTPYDSATASTFNLGVLRAGQEKRYVLPLTPVRRGSHRVGYALSGDLYGNAKIVNEDNSPAANTRLVAIDPTPVFDESVFK